MTQQRSFLNKEWLSDLLENLEQGIVMINESFEITFFNNKAAVLFNITSGFSKDIDSILSHIKEHQQKYKQFSNSFRYTTYSTTYKEDVLIKTQPLVDERRNFKGCLLLCKVIESQESLIKQIDFSEKKYSYLFESTTDGVLLFNDEAYVIDANKSALYIFDIDFQHKKNIQVADLFPHQSVEKSMVIWENFLKSGELKSFYKYEKKNQSPVYIDFCAKAHILPGVHMVIFKDLSSTIVLNKAFKQTESNLQSLFKNSTHAIFLFDDKDKLITYNEKALFYMNLKNEEAARVQMSFYEAKILPISNVHVQELLARLKEGEVLTEQYSILNPKTNDRLWFEYSLIPFLNDKQGLVNYCLTLQDITDKKKVEKDLIESEKKFRNLTENSPNIIYIIDFEKREFPYFNRSEILGYDTKELSTFEKWESLLHPEDIKKVKDHFSKFLSNPTGNSSAIDYRMKNADGVYEWLHNRHSILDRLSSGRIYRMIVNLTFITEQKKQEEDIKRTNFELDSFVYKASHDLRAPLKSILGLVHLAFNESNELEREKYLKMVEKSVSRLDIFIEDLTNFSRNNRMDATVQEIYFEELLNSVWDHLKYMDTHSSIKFEKDIKHRYTFHSDVNRLQILFQNILSNAVKYRNTNLKEANIKIRIRSIRKGVWIEIEDNGIGIKQEYIDRIFDMFFRASPDSHGSGLGLYIAKQVVEKLGGTIEVESTYGEGTKFTIYLPTVEL
ncbi:MAG: PAS domain-containing sensor histidine kinase [Cytophagaceae bacterium]|jgi:PAS domain S-box-containing protein|nr:PAS domain-containing sensor histidine kinase [Cytophagaceae bacterium]